MRILIDILHPAHVHFFRNFYEVMSEPRPRALHHRAGQGPVRRPARAVRPPVRADLGAEERRRRAGHRDDAAHRAPLMRSWTRFQPDVMTGIMGPSIALAGTIKQVPGGRVLRHRVRPPDELVRLPARPQRRHARLLPGQGARHPRPLRRLPRARVPAPEPLHTGPGEARRRSASSRASGTRSCGSSRGRRCTTASETGLHRGAEARPRRHASAATAACSSRPRRRSPDDLSQLEVKGPVEDIHHLLAHAQMIVGESATMSSEAAVLGVPAVMIATTGRGYTDDEERRYGLVRHFTDDQYDQRGRDRRAARSRSSPRELGAAGPRAAARRQDRRHAVDGRLLRVHLRGDP